MATEAAPKVKGRSSKGGAYEFESIRDHDRLMARIALIREAKQKKSATTNSGDPHLTSEEMDVILEPMSEWVRFESKFVADHVHGIEDGIVRPYTRIIGTGVNRLDVGVFEARPRIGKRRFYCGRYSTYEEALAASEAKMRGEEVGMDFPGRHRVGFLPAGSKYLNPAQVQEIRALYKKGWSIERLAMHFKRGVRKIRDIIAGKTYKDTREKNNEANGCKLLTLSRKRKVS